MDAGDEHLTDEDDEFEPARSQHGQPARLRNELYDWIRSLPFVIERPPIANDLRAFAVECELLARRATWMIVKPGLGLGKTTSTVVLVLPRALARVAEQAHLGTGVMPWPRDQLLFETDRRVPQEVLDDLVLAAYSCALS